LDAVLTRLPARQEHGGGGVNSTREIARLRDDLALGLKVHLFDSGNFDGQLHGEMTACGVDYIPLGLDPMGKNLVLTSGADVSTVRTIVRGRVQTPAALNGQWSRIEKSLGGGWDTVIVNSLRSDKVAEAAVEDALDFNRRPRSRASALPQPR
jgi:hypothetical protein